MMAACSPVTRRYYLAPFRNWWPQERRAMRFVRGRVLDLGCGAGRVSLGLQPRVGGGRC
jgi:ubiquinone/menaquinone biosynthesis C-methylase UbiE